MFLTDLIEDNKSLIESYGEEDLKVNFIVPILNKIRFNLPFAHLLASIQNCAHLDIDRLRESEQFQYTVL